MKKISVSGIRGKSSFIEYLGEVLQLRGYNVFMKITGDIPLVKSNKGKEVIKRTGPSILYENLRLPTEGYDFLIAENQGITPYTCKVFNKMLKPDLGVITNIRLDHVESLGRNTGEIQKSFNYAYAGIPTIYGKPSGVIPKAELIDLVDECLVALRLEGLTQDERRYLNERIKNDLTPRQLSNCLYFNGAKINDVESTAIMYNYLKKNYPTQFVIFANFRKDRVGRTKTFISFLEDCVKMGDVVYLHGKGADYVKKKINYINVDVIKSDAPEDALLTLKNAAEGRLIFTCGNGATDYMRQLDRLFT